MTLRDLDAEKLLLFGYAPGAALAVQATISVGSPRGAGQVDGGPLRSRRAYLAR
jgi:hypothetical protein